MNIPISGFCRNLCRRVAGFRQRWATKFSTKVVECRLLGRALDVYLSALVVGVALFASFVVPAQILTRPPQEIPPRVVRSAPAVRAPARPRSLNAGIAPLGPRLQP